MDAEMITRKLDALNRQTLRDAFGRVCIRCGKPARRADPLLHGVCAGCDPRDHGGFTARISVAPAHP